MSPQGQDQHFPLCEKQMGILQVSRFKLWFTLLVVAVIQWQQIQCSTYQVGDLDAWGIPPSLNPQVYTKWSKFHNINIGDSLFFLCPPSQDSVIQVGKDSFNSCNLKDPILVMNNGNSLFNITKGGDYYFTSGVDGHCEKSQKLHIFVYGNGSVADSPADGPTASAPSYPTVFGSIPVQGASSTSSSSLLQISAFVSAAALFFHLWLSL